MTVETFFGALLLALLGIGGALTVAGHRYRKTLLFWSGVMILIVVVGFLAINVFLLISCWSGAGCI